MKRLRQVLLVLLYSLYGLYAVIACVICLAVGGVVVLLMPTLGARRWVARWTLRVLFFVAAMRYHIEGLEQLGNRPCIVIANHRTYLDGLALIAALPPHFSPVIKHEMAEVPFIGWFLAYIGCRFVEREPAILAGRDTRDLLLALEAGESLAIFPEGTFSTDLGLLPFRDGAFFLAAKAQVPIVPAAIDGAPKILPEDRFLPWPGKLSVHVFARIEPDGDDREAADRLRDNAESVLSRKLGSRRSGSSRETRDYRYYCEVFSGRPLPLSYLDLDLLERNIRSIIARSGSKKLRVDARVLQCPGVLQRVTRSNARFHGIKCSTVAEAIHLLQSGGLSDMLVAYPTVQHDALDTACAALADGREITLTVDSPAHLGYLAEAALHARVSMPVCVEIDMSTANAGMQQAGRRSAVRSLDDLLTLVDAIDQLPGVHFRGVLTYDTQPNHFAEWITADDRGAGTALSESDVERVRGSRHAIAQALQARGHEDILFNCGGIGGIAFNAGHTAVTEITVGAELLGLDPEDPMVVPAAGYVAEIMRRTDQDRYACLIGGHVSSHVVDAKSLPQPYLPRGARLDELHAAGAAQLPIRYVGELAVGDMIFLHPTNTDELCEHFSRLLLVQRGAIVSEAETYRV